MSPSSDASAEVWVALPDDNEVVTTFADHYGVAAETFADHRFWRHRRGTIWLTHRAVTLARVARLEAIGLRVRRNDAHPTQASVAFMRRFFGEATRRVIRLEDDVAVAAYWGRERRQLDPPEGDGYYVVMGPQGRVLGRARVSAGQLQPELPRHDRPPVGL